jgi:hypothetical protein
MHGTVGFLWKGSENRRFSVERFGRGVRGETQCLVNVVPRSVGFLIRIIFY